jgi:hypothetical protein
MVCETDTGGWWGGTNHEAMVGCGGRDRVGMVCQKKGNCGTGVWRGMEKQVVIRDKGCMCRLGGGVFICGQGGWTVEMEGGGREGGGAPPLPRRSISIV